MRIQTFFWFALALWSVAGCCKAECPHTTMDLKFVGYQNTDIDTVWVEKFKSGSNFQVVMDTIRAGIQEPSYDTLFLFIDNIDANADYQVSGPSLSRKYRVSDLHTSSKRCSCGGHFQQVSGYMLDGVAGAGPDIYLKK